MSLANLGSSAGDKLQCPRCSRVVTDRHGICRNCHENAYQCRLCRNINYEKLDAFLCNECGYCRYARFEFTLHSRPSYTAERIENEDDCLKAMDVIDRELENAHKRFSQLAAFKKPLSKLLTNFPDFDSETRDSIEPTVSMPGIGSTLKINQRIAMLGVIYGKECSAAFESLSRSVQLLQATRQELLKFQQRAHKVEMQDLERELAARLPSRQKNKCYG